jgi:hypothetical protein
VPGGSSGFNNAKLDAIPLTSSASVTVAPGDTLSLRLSVRNTCSGKTHNSGTARLWFNDSQANSHFDATISGTTKGFLPFAHFGSSFPRIGSLVLSNKELPTVFLSHCGQLPI